MNLSEEVKRIVGGWQPFSGTSRLLTASVNGQSLECELLALDSLACAFVRFNLQSAALAGAAMDKLKKVADDLSRRLTYLLEPISPLEIDALGCLVQLRSSPPAKDADGTSYYELLVKHTGDVSLCRFNRPPGAPRNAIPAQVTREVLLRLVADFSAVAH